MIPASSNRSGSLALDQWRGLALVLVLISHGFHETHRVEGIGRAGVNLFFFISGILVFRSLAGSSAVGWKQLTGRFWFHRFRRLYPALLAYMLVVLLAKFGLQSLSTTWFDFGFKNFWKTFPAAGLYYANYIEAPAMVLGHLWSLACEMQFYLLAPLIFLGGGATAGRRILVFGSILFLLLLLGATEAFISKDPFSGKKYHFEFAVWPMMLGFFCEYKKNWFTMIPARLTNWTLWFAMSVCIACLVPMLLGLNVKLLVIAGGTFLLLPCLLMYVGGKKFDHRSGEVLHWLGVRTYSIYLWQQPFTLCFFLPVHWWPVGALASIGVGALWFRWFERPFLSVARQGAGGRR